jgi:hypothetical protein
MGFVRTMYWNIGVIAIAIGITIILIENFRIYGIILLLSGAIMIMFEYFGGVHRVQEFLEEGEDYEGFLEEKKEDEGFLEDEQRKLDEEEKYLAELERKKKENGEE